VSEEPLDVEAVDERLSKVAAGKLLDSGNFHASGGSIPEGFSMSC
jgi:hypothetical protein